MKKFVTLALLIAQPGARSAAAATPRSRSPPQPARRDQVVLFVSHRPRNPSEAGLCLRQMNKLSWNPDYVVRRKGNMVTTLVAMVDENHRAPGPAGDE